MSLAESYTNILAGGLASLKVKATGDVGYYAFLPPISHNVSIEGVGDADEYLRKRSHAYLFKSEVDVPVLKTQANMLDLLPLMSGIKMQSKYTGISGQIINSNPTAIVESGFGFKWRLIIDSGVNKSIILKIMQDRGLTKADRELILTAASAEGDGSQDVGDDLNPMKPVNMLNADIAPSGVLKVEVGLTGTTYTDVISKIRNAKFEAELLTGAPDECGRSISNGQVKIDFSCDAMQSAQSELLLYDNLETAALDIKVTFLSTWVATMVDRLGMQSSYVIGKDVNDDNIVKIACSGSIPLSVWASSMWS
jgi:hypothetical protein